MAMWAYEIWFDGEYIYKDGCYETEAEAEAFAETEIAEMMEDEDFENTKRKDFEIKTYQEWIDFD